MQLKLENIEMNNVNTDVTETSETAFINEFEISLSLIPMCHGILTIIMAMEKQKITRPPTVTVDIPSSNTFNEETCSVSHNICNICTLHIPYTMFCH